MKCASSFCPRGLLILLVVALVPRSVLPEGKAARRIEHDFSSSNRQRSHRPKSRPGASTKTTPPPALTILISASRPS